MTQHLASSPKTIKVEDVPAETYGPRAVVASNSVSLLWRFETAEQRDAFVAKFAEQGARAAP